MEVVPDVVEVPAGTPLTLNVVNEGQAPHNLALSGGPKTPDLKTGEKATLEVGTVSKAMTGECSIPGHKVDHEYLLVQSELYLGPQGQPGSLRKMQNESWDAVVFNGYAPFDEPGLYPIVTHKLANVAKGALGLFHAGDVQGPAPATDGPEASPRRGPPALGGRAGSGQA